MERRASTARETAYLPFLFVPHAQQPLVDAVFISPNESTSFVLVGAVTKTKPARLFFSIGVATGGSKLIRAFQKR